MKDLEPRDQVLHVDLAGRHPDEGFSGVPYTKGALFLMRLEQFEQTQVEWNQSGKPTTTVRLRAALVDSTGRLLWSAAGSETGEGQYHEADAGTTGVNGSGLNTTPTTAQGGAPSFEDVTTRLLDRWMKRFPARPTAATSAAPGKP
jgi:hypothetical protein